MNVIRWKLDWSKDLNNRIAGGLTPPMSITTNTSFFTSYPAKRAIVEAYLAGLAIPSITNLLAGQRANFLYNLRDHQAFYDVASLGPSEFYNYLVTKSGKEKISFTDISFYLLGAEPADTATLPGSDLFSQITVNFLFY